MNIEGISKLCSNMELRNLKKIGDVILCGKKEYGCPLPFKIPEIEYRKICIVMSLYRTNEGSVRIIDIDEKKTNNCPYINKE